MDDSINNRDTGCLLYSSCLSCPLSRCLYDEPSREHPKTRIRYKDIYLLRQSGGYSIETIAQLFNVSKRTVYRALARNRGGIG